MYSIYNLNAFYFIETMLQTLVRFPASKDYLIYSQPETVCISDFSNWDNHIAVLRAGTM